MLILIFRVAQYVAITKTLLFNKTEHSLDSRVLLLGHFLSNFLLSSDKFQLTFLLYLSAHYSLLLTFLLVLSSFSSYFFLFFLNNSKSFPFISSSTVIFYCFMKEITFRSLQLPRLAHNSKPFEIVVTSLDGLKAK